MGGVVGGGEGQDDAKKQDDAINRIIRVLDKKGYDELALKKDIVQKEIIDICKSCGVLASCNSIVRSVLTTLNHDLENSNTSSYYNNLLAPFMNLAGMPEQYIEKEEYDQGGMRIRNQEENPAYTKFMANRGI